MRLNHLNLVVPDVQKSWEFFETYFGLRSIGPQNSSAIALLTDESGFVLNLSNFDKVSEVEYPHGFHIGFMQESSEQVDAIYERLKSAGFEVEQPKEFHGAWTFYFRAPGGFVIEVLYQHSMSKR